MGGDGGACPDKRLEKNLPNDLCGKTINKLLSFKFYFINKHTSSFNKKQKRLHVFLLFCNVFREIIYIQKNILIRSTYSSMISSYV